MKKDHTKSIIDTSLEQAKMWGNAEYMEDGVVLTDRIADAHIPSDPTRLNFILMALCKRGRAQYSIDTREQTVNPGDLLFISERHIIDNYMASPDFECMCIMLSTDFYHGFIQNVKNVSSLLIFSTNNPVVPLTPMEIQTFSNYFQTIREKMTDKHHHFRKELVNALLLAMFYDMSNVIWRVEQKDTQSYTRAEAFFAQFIRLLEDIGEVVKVVSQRTPNEWIDKYVILEARVLLKNSTKSIKEITDELCFPNQSFFGKYFKEHVGVSPSDYRKV